MDSKVIRIFRVSNEVHQGKVLNPILLKIYTDTSRNNCRSAVVITTGTVPLLVFFCYVNDLSILAPSPDTQRKMTVDHEDFVKSHELLFNTSKT